ncbi:hypothetical protein MLD38_029421 [Melastoma candidum]|uniref:Uncharacterized protein n=1 Tax=Melastoma candidum TaxID=119954 RepID=A0ACB9N4U9_9MYRT|nr:hypothetical protein MLD38_029421 [Melastoma candidum]
MWRRLVSSHLKTLAVASSAPRCVSAAAGLRGDRAPVARIPSSFLSSRWLAAGSGESAVKKKVEDVMPIATGHEREELEAELEGRNILEIDHPVGPFGTKEAPAVVKSVFDKRIVGCPGGEGEDEHDVVWFWLKKGQPHECPVCSQYFVLEVVGPGGSPYGHGEDKEHH